MYYFVLCCVIFGNLLEQNEKFINYGIFLVTSLKLNSFIINPGIRLDKNTISIDDRFLADGNSSDKINLNSLNPSLGINYKSNSFNRFFVCRISGEKMAGYPAISVSGATLQ